MPFKFIHTADLHLDSPLKSLALRNPAVADLVGGATRRALERLIDLCLDEEVDALILAGDLYDGDLRSMKTAAFLVRQLQRLHERGIRVFAIRGNHDAEAAITQHLDLPANVHLFNGHGGVVELHDYGVAIHGVSYKQRHAPESLLHKFKQPVAGLINIGILHTSLAGAQGHDVYAPCSVSDLIAHGFDYWALGHLHQRRVYCESPFVVMAGMPQGRDIGEAGPKSVTLVEASNQEIRIEERFIADAEFRRIEVDLTAIAEWREAVSAVERTLTKAMQDLKARHLICRVVLRGCSPLYWRLRRDADLFEAEAHEIAQQRISMFLEGVENDVKPLQNAKEATPLDELEHLMAAMAKDNAFQTAALAWLETAVSQLPPELRDRYGYDHESREEKLQRLLLSGIADTIAVLKSGAGAGLCA